MPAVSLNRRSALVVLLLTVCIGLVTGLLVQLLQADGHMRLFTWLNDGSGELIAFRLDILLLSLLAIVIGAAGVMLILQGRGQAAIISNREAELARLSWRLDYALAASEIGAWDVDLATDELNWDDRALALFDAPERDGYYSEEDWLKAVHPDDRDRALNAAGTAVDTGGRFVQDYRVVHSDGSVRHLRDMAAVYQAEDGTRRLTGLVWDVTRDIEHQEELQLRRAEAEEAAQVKAQFLATMSHEIRTPMTGVLGMLDLLSEEDLTGRQAERLTIARTSARVLMQILNDVLEFSRLESRSIELHREPVQPRRLVGDVIGLMTPVAEERGLRLCAGIEDAVPETVECDAVRLSQVLTNLTSNAVKFSERGEVTLRAGYVDGTLRFEVEDTGVGIDEDDIARLFDKFYRVDSTLVRHSGGTGLGLAICRELVDLMGGQISVNSVPGQGSIFAFSVEAPECSLPARNGLGETSDGSEPAEEPMTLLVAEDNATNQYLIRIHLEKAGHSVTLVGNGSEAVREVETGRYDAVLMDVQMPVMDGTSATRAIRALPGEAAQTPVIALTASALSSDRETYVAAGMDDLVSKPINAAELWAALRRVRRSADGDPVDARTRPDTQAERRCRMG